MSADSALNSTYFHTSSYLQALTRRRAANSSSHAVIHTPLKSVLCPAVSLRRLRTPSQCSAHKNIGTSPEGPTLATATYHVNVSSCPPLLLLADLRKCAETNWEIRLMQRGFSAVSATDGL